MADRRRFLVATLDGAGNWPPERVLIGRLVQRGHEVRVMSHAVHALDVREAGAGFRPYAPELTRDPTIRRDETPENEMARVIREVYVNPLFAEPLLAEVTRDRPDVLLVDQMLPIAQAAAETTGLPMAILWHTVYGAMGQRGPRIADAALDSLNQFREQIGLGRVPDRMAVTRKADAIVAFTYEAFDMALEDRPAQLHYVGPLACIAGPREGYVLPWAADDRRPLVLVSYSTSFQNQVPTLQRVADALADLPVRALMTLGRAISADELRLPANVVAERFVPHASVLPEARLVVTHAGHGTVMAAVTAGVPLVCTPMGRDQHAVAACVERNGLGIVVPATASSAELRAAMTTALADRDLHQRARAFVAGVDVAAGLERAVAVLEALDVRDQTAGQ